MRRPVVAIVTGFTRARLLMERSMETLLRLRRDGVIDRILYVTWDRPDIDVHLEPLASMPEVDLARVPQPDLRGSHFENSIVYQIRNLEAALALVPEDEALVLKTRPDFIIAEPFLRAKIEAFDTLCAPPDYAETLGLFAPPRQFARKMWVPWSFGSIPFFNDDAVFMGMKGDVAKLADRRAEPLLAPLDDYDRLILTHVGRFVAPFWDAYPIFRNYVRNIHCFLHHEEFRRSLLLASIGQPFFWRLIIAHAWVLATHFHVDAGKPGDLLFFSNHFNPKADWNDPATWRVEPPYNDVEEWRGGQHPGQLVPCVRRMFSRLTDDWWQHALFAPPGPSDFALANIAGVLADIFAYDPDRQDEEETAFYAAINAVHQTEGDAARQELAAARAS